MISDVTQTPKSSHSMADKHVLSLMRCLRTCCRELRTIRKPHGDFRLPKFLTENDTLQSELLWEFLSFFSSKHSLRLYKNNYYYDAHLKIEFLVLESNSFLLYSLHFPQNSSSVPALTAQCRVSNIVTLWWKLWWDMCLIFCLCS